MTTGNIAGNVAHTSERVGLVNTAMVEEAQSVKAIPSDITEVAHATDAMSQTSSEVKASPIELSDIAEKLNVMVNQFKF